MEFSYKLKLEKHIQALEKAYKNIIDVLNEDIDIALLRDEKIKVYAEGQLKSADTADALLQKIKEKKEELELLKNPEAPTKKEETSKKSESSMNQHLE